MYRHVMPLLHVTIVTHRILFTVTTHWIYITHTVLLLTSLTMLLLTSLRCNVILVHVKYFLIHIAYVIHDQFVSVFGTLVVNHIFCVIHDLWEH